MVLKYCDHGFPYHEPPYKLEEQMEISRRSANVVAYTRPAKAVPVVGEEPDGEGGVKPPT